MKENIVIIEATSSAANYIHDIRQLGHNPVCLELHKPEELREIYRMHYDLSYALDGEEPPEILQADESYEKTLEMVKKLNPICIIPGNDDALVWATRMAHDLGLPGNNPDNLKKMIDKNSAQEALKDANIRYIKSKIVKTFDEAKEFISELDGDRYVVKPTKGNGTVGVCICKNDEELENAIALNNELSSNKEGVEILMQEYIGGEEFIINTICCQGHNRVDSAYLYHKILIEGRGAVYDYTETIDQSHPDFARLEEYNDKVLKALGIEYGTMHGEYKVDENGPVLIEMNCRISGGSQRYAVIDEAWGEHSTMSSLESYLNPEECIKKSKKPMKLQSSYLIKYIILYEDTYIVKSHLEEMLGDLDSYRYEVHFKEDHLYPKTIDLATAAGFIYLVNKDKNKLLKDLEKIRHMEKYEIGKLFEIK